jgi:predicted nucleic-acid-binding protein
MPALDTNVLVRLLVKDDAAQTEAAKKRVSDAVAAGGSLFVPVAVSLELEWVLRSAYGFGKADVIAALAGLLSAADLSLESESAVEIALALYGQSAADFADCLHVALAEGAGKAPLWTFDRAAAKVAGARLLSGQRSG